jgi:predicted nucleotidyltransferase
MFINVISLVSIMLTKEQLNILGVFRKDIFASMTFRQIKEQSRQKSNNVVQIALKEFQEEGLVRVTKTGDVSAYSLDLESNLVLSYLSLINEHEITRSKVPKEAVDDIERRIFRHTEFFILLVFGSYAKEKVTKKSDLDIAVIVESDDTRKEIAPFIETVKRREVVSIDYHIFTRAEFLELLKADFENVGKQIFRNSLVYYGYETYCNMIGGIKNEWRG